MEERYLWTGWYCLGACEQEDLTFEQEGVLLMRKTMGMTVGNMWLFPEEMTNGRDRMLLHHTRARIAHDFADFRTFSFAVTMVRAFFAGDFRLSSNIAAVAGTFHGITVDLGTFRAKGFAAMGGQDLRGSVVVSRAIDAHHLGNDAHVPLSSSSGFRRISGRLARRGGFALRFAAAGFMVVVGGRHRWRGILYW